MDLSLDLLLGSETPLLSLNLILFEFDLFDVFDLLGFNSRLMSQEALRDSIHKLKLETRIRLYYYSTRISPLAPGQVADLS